MQPLTCLLAALGFLYAMAPAWAGELPPGHGPAEMDRLDVTRVWSDGGGRIISQKEVDGHKVLHGVQLTVGEKNWLKEIAVYNAGQLEQRTQFYPNGRVFLEQRREHNGNGSEIVYSPEREKISAENVVAAKGDNIGPIKVQEVLSQGEIRGDRRWSGSFLEAVRDGFARKWMLREYREGKVVSSVAFPLEKLALPPERADIEHWLWEIPSWPATP